MFNILQKYGFGNNFLQWIRMIYMKPMASVKTNSNISKPFILYRGTKQRCPASGLLLNLVTEPLAKKIWSDKNIQWIKTGSQSYKISILWWYSFLPNRSRLITSSHQPDNHPIQSFIGIQSKLGKVWVTAPKPIFFCQLCAKYKHEMKTKQNNISRIKNTTNIYQTWDTNLTQIVSKNR